MKAAALVQLVRRDLRRSGGALSTTGFGIAAGTAALVFFLALGLGVRKVLLGDVFPLDRVELEPRAKPEPGFLTLLLGGGGGPPPGVTPPVVDDLRRVPGVVQAYPKLRFAFPAGAFGGKELLGQDVGTHEMIADGVDPELVRADVTGSYPFVDPLATPGPQCRADADCGEAKYCELPSGAASGQCSNPVPVLVSRYVVELFNKAIAPAHGYPQIGGQLLARAEGMTFSLNLGVSMLGRATKGTPRSVRARVVGISPSAIDLGLTLPLPVVARFNREFAGDAAAQNYSSVLVRTASGSDVATVVAAGANAGLEPKDTRARDVSVLLNGIVGVLTLVAGVMLAVAASNTAYTFRVLVDARRAEIGLYRALGATPSDVRTWMLALATLVGALAGAIGVVVARLVAFGADRLAATKLPDFPFKPDTFFAFPAWLLGFAALFGAVAAVVGAWPAARRAARLDPAAALVERT